jgi:hypothetical protein
MHRSCLIRDNVEAILLNGGWARHLWDLPSHPHVLMAAIRSDSVGERKGIDISSQFLCASVSLNCSSIPRQIHVEGHLATHQAILPRYCGFLDPFAGEHSHSGLPARQPGCVRSCQSHCFGSLATARFFESSVRNRSQNGICCPPVEYQCAATWGNRRHGRYHGSSTAPERTSVCD